MLDEAVRVGSTAVSDGLSLRVVRSVGGVVTFTGQPNRINITLRDSRTGHVAMDADSPFTRSYVQVELPTSAVAFDRSEYHVKLDSSLLEDYAGNAFIGFRSTTSWAFSTSDVLPPSVAQSTPSNGATGVSPRITTLQLKMSEEVQPMPGGRVSIYRKHTGAVAIAGADIIASDSSYAEAMAFGTLRSDLGLFIATGGRGEMSQTYGRGAGANGWTLVERFAADDSTRVSILGDTIDMRLRAATTSEYGATFLVNITASPHAIGVEEIGESAWATANFSESYASTFNSSLPIYDAPGGFSDLSGKPLGSYHWTFTTR